MKKWAILTFSCVMLTVTLAGFFAPVAKASEAPIICKFQHCVPAGQTGIIHQGETFGRFLEQETNGRIKVKYYPDGTIVPGNQIVEAVNSGGVDATVVCGCFTIGKSFASAYFCNGPGSLGVWPKMLWYFEGNGLELARKFIYKQYPNVVLNVGGLMMTEPWLYCNKKINTVEDFKGLKVRASGIRAKVYAKLGMAAVGMARGEIMPSMKTGVIDGFELATFWTDKDLGLTDVAKYMYIGNKYVEGGVAWTMFNKKWFSKLPEDLQKAAERACHTCMHYNASELAYMEAKTMHDAEKKGEIEIIVLPEQVQDAIFSAAMDLIYERIQSGDKEMEEFWKSQWNFYLDWKKIIEVEGHVGKWHYMEELVPEKLKKIK
jgi:TRAP-type mannitol/chloroaromatic compound transport system substrate-binding protein